MKTTRPAELEIDQDLQFQRREWIAQRVGWVVMAAIVVAAILGLFGAPGPLASAHVESESRTLAVSYPRFMRLQAPATLHIELSPSSDDSTIHLWIDRDYLEGLTIDRITPEPVSRHFGGGRIVYDFPVEHSSQSATIVIDAKTKRFGSLSGDLGLVNGPSVHIHQFIYP